LLLLQTVEKASPVCTDEDELIIIEVVEAMKPIISIKVAVIKAVEATKPIIAIEVSVAEVVLILGLNLDQHLSFSLSFSLGIRMVLVPVLVFVPALVLVPVYVSESLRFSDRRI